MELGMEWRKIIDFKFTFNWTNCIFFCNKKRCTSGFRSAIYREVIMDGVRAVPVAIPSIIISLEIYASYGIWKTFLFSTKKWIGKHWNVFNFKIFDSIKRKKVFSCVQLPLNHNSQSAVTLRIRINHISRHFSK